MTVTDHMGLLGGLGHGVASLTVIPGATNTRGAAHKMLPASTCHHLTVESSNRDRAGDRKVTTELLAECLAETLDVVMEKNCVFCLSRDDLLHSKPITYCIRTECVTNKEQGFTL